MQLIVILSDTTMYSILSGKTVGLLCYKYTFTETGFAVSLGNDVNVTNVDGALSLAYPSTTVSIFTVNYNGTMYLDPFTREPMRYVATDGGSILDAHFFPVVPMNNYDLLFQVPPEIKCTPSL